ncbi:MAG: chemotaxis protein CheX [Nocardioidaceae bacterium]
MSGATAVDDEVVRSIIDQVWEALFGAVAVPWAGEESVDVRGLRAQVSLRGDWNGLVRMTCGTGTAERLAGTMLMAEPDEVLSDEDVHDAVGEVVNVVGGNVKGALGGHTSLGLPVVDVTSTSDDTVPASRTVVDWFGAPVVLEVFAA